MNSTKEMTALVEGHESERGLGLAEQQEHKQVQTKSEIQVSAPTVKASKVSLAPTQSSQPESKSISPTTTIMKDDGDISVAESEAFSFASDPSVDPIFCVGDAVIPSPPSPKEDTIKEEPPKKMETAITRRTVPSPPSPSIRQNSMVVVQTPPQARTRRSPSAKMSLSKSSPRRRKRLSNLDLSNTPTIVEVENEDQDEMMDIGTMNIGPEDESFVRLLQFIRHSNYFHPHELPLEGIDVLIQKRVRFFQLAQAERKKRYEFKPYGIIGLYTNLADIRADLLWAGDTAKNLEQHLPYIRWETFELKRRRLIQAYFTYTILLASAVTMVLAFRENGWAIEPLQENILVGPTSQVLLDMGALQTKLLVDHGEYYRLFTSIFVHAGLIHLMINLLAIWLLCGCLETNHGPMMAGIIFLVSAVGGNMWSAVMQPGYILVGASGGIFGVFGALIADCVLNWKLLFHVLRSRTPQRNQCVYVCITISLLLLDVILNSIVGLTPFVDNFAHMGGMIYGFLLGSVLLRRLSLRFFGRGGSPWYNTRIFLFRTFGGITAFLLSLIVSLLLYQHDGMTSPCFECRFISCVPFPFWTEDKWWYCDGCDAASGEVFYMGDQTDVFNRLEIYCPQGGSVFLDISSYQWTEISEVHNKLSAFCRSYCY